MAQIRRGEGQLDDAVGAIDRHPLSVVGHAGKIEMAHAHPPAAGKAEGEMRAAAIVEDGAMLGARPAARQPRCGQHAVHHRDVVDQR